MIFRTRNEEESIELGVRLGKALNNKSAVILLEGNLAAGKTTFTKGIAKGLGISSIIKSPTFTIMKQYKSENNILYHLDLYRLDSIGNDFDLEEYVDDKNSVVVIEWPFQVQELLPKKYILINITGDNNDREFKITYKGNYEEVLKSL